MVYFLKMRPEVFPSIYWVAYNTDLLWPFGVQHVYFCIDNVVIFDHLITDTHVFSLWETQNSYI